MQWDYEYTFSKVLKSLVCVRKVGNSAVSEFISAAWKKELHSDNLLVLQQDWDLHPLVGKANLEK